MFPVNVYRFFVATVVRPAVYFCTYPELRGDLEVPEAPTLERLRWGEKCRKTLWSDWGACSARCGSGYRARVDHSRRARRQLSFHLDFKTQLTSTQHRLP